LSVVHDQSHVPIINELSESLRLILRWKSIPPPGSSCIGRDSLWKTSAITANILGILPIKYVGNTPVRDRDTPSDKPTIGFRVEVVIEPDANGYHAYCPALKGVHIYGITEEEALRNAGDAASAYLHSLIKRGEPIPPGVVREGI
jgi:predicted RNase H-like HicB family nuclease